MRGPLLVLVACTTAGCSAIRFGSEGPLDGFWEGALLIEGQSIASSLVLDAGDGLEATLSAPSLRLEANGEGSATGNDFRLELSYELTCPGVMTLAGRVQSRERLTGNLEASDCTGTVTGTFGFTRAGPGR